MPTSQGIIPCPKFYPLVTLTNECKAGFGDQKICTIDVCSSDTKKDDHQGLGEEEHGAGGDEYEQDGALPDIDGPGVPLLLTVYALGAV